jgi:hypothetical protein
MSSAPKVHHILHTTLPTINLTIPLHPHLHTTFTNAPHPRHQIPKPKRQNPHKLRGMRTVGAVKGFYPIE